MVALGIVFQIPAVIFVLSRIGLLTAGMLVRSVQACRGGLRSDRGNHRATTDFGNMLCIPGPMIVLCTAWVSLSRGPLGGAALSRELQPRGMHRAKSKRWWVENLQPRPQVPRSEPLSYLLSRFAANVSQVAPAQVTIIECAEGPSRSGKIRSRPRHDVTDPRHAARPLRDPCPPRYRWHGGSVESARHAAQSHRRGEAPHGASTATVRAGSASDCCAQPPQSAKSTTSAPTIWCWSSSRGRRWPIDSAAARRRGLPPEEALRIARQIAEGLEEAHRAGILHRDLKPGNVMITTKGAAKLLDFGLARLVSVDADVTRTLDGTVLGTPPTCRRSRPKANRSMCGRTSSASAPCCTRCSLGRVRLPGRLRCR